MLHLLLTATIILQTLIVPATGVVHCHAGMTADEAREHASKPHVHTRDRRHAISHHSQGRQHHKAALAPSQRSGSLSRDIDPAPLEHDADAAFVDRCDGVAEHGKQTDFQPACKGLAALRNDLLQTADDKFRLLAPVPLCSETPQYLCLLVLRL